MCPMNPRLLVPRATGIASPLVISGCIGWYDSLDLTAMAQNSDGTGAVAVGDQVGYWKDKSTTAAHVTQGIGANRPTLTSNQVNGRAALRFDGSNDTLSSAAGYTAQNSLAGLTRVAVCSSGQGAHISRVFTGGSDVAFSLVSATLRSFATDTNGVSVPQTGTLPLRIYASVFDGSAPSLNIFFNNVAQTPTTLGTLPATTGGGSPTLHIGSNIGLNAFTLGPIAEYIVYNRALSSAQLTAVYQYLRKKWGFA
jgi:hypothetical protein